MDDFCEAAIWRRNENYCWLANLNVDPPPFGTSINGEWARIKIQGKDAK